VKAHQPAATVLWPMKVSRSNHFKRCLGLHCRLPRIAVQCYRAAPKRLAGPLIHEKRSITKWHVPGYYDLAAIKRSREAMCMNWAASDYSILPRLVLQVSLSE
jgi:hypothetical protein